MSFVPLFRCEYPSMPTHIMLCDHGVHGLAYRETDPEQADEESIVDLMLLGECDRPVSVIAFDEHAGWARDASVDIARKIAGKAERRGIDLLLTPVLSLNATAVALQSFHSSHGSHRSKSCAKQWR